MKSKKINKENIINFIKKFKAYQIGAIAFVLTFAIINTLGFAVRCADIRTDVLRLHVLANSDTEIDQEIKLAVRDTILTTGAEIFDGSVTADAAADKISPQIDTLAAAARETIAGYGYDYDVEIQITEEYFDTRTYEDITLPAGKYNAVKVLIGEGSGQNWWCVMFPPLCLPAASGSDTADEVDAVFSNDEIKVIESSPKYEVRFKIVELYEKAANSISSRLKNKS